MSNKENKKGYKGCLNGCIGLPVFLAITSAIIVPYIPFNAWYPSANSSRAKNVLSKAMRDCNSKFFEGIDKPTFEDIGLPEMPPHPDWPQDIYSFYTDSSFLNSIKKSDSCFSLAAKPRIGKLTWFSIKYDPKNDLVTKKCGDSEKKYCEKGNTW